MKLLDLTTIAKRLEKAFPDCDLGLVQRIAMKDAKERTESRPGWHMVIAEKLEKGD